MTIRPLTEQEKKRATPYGLRLLIKATEEQLRNPYRNDREDLTEDLNYYKSLLAEITEV